MTQYLVLSYGRSGSVLLALTIAAKLNASLRCVGDRDRLDHSQVQHSHLFFENTLTIGYQRIFNLRKNPTNTILSLILANKYNQYHRFTGTTTYFAPFEFTQWHMIDGACEFYRTYHHWYAQRLEPNDAVIFYEDFVATLSNPTKHYEPIYPNKEQLLVNYQQVVEYINQYNLVDSHTAFTGHINQLNDPIWIDLQ